MNVKRNFECRTTGTAYEKKTCKRRLCQIEERERQEQEKLERVEQERLERARQYPALAAIVERLVEKLKKTNPGCFRQPRQ
jgi:hypothetical protein